MRLLFSGERTRPRVPISAPRRNASLAQPGKVVGEAPATAREGACAPRTSIATTTTNSSVCGRRLDKHTHAVAVGERSGRGIDWRQQPRFSTRAPVLELAVVNAAPGKKSSLSKTRPT